MTEPGCPDPLSDCQIGDAVADRQDMTDDFVPRNERQFGAIQIAVDHMKIGAADCARCDFDKHLATTWTRSLPLNQLQSLTDSHEHHRLHVATLFIPAEQSF